MDSPTLEQLVAVLALFVLFCVGLLVLCILVLQAILEELRGARDERRKDLSDIHRVLTEKEDERINGKEHWGI